jgi:hypothetical protein
MTSFAGGLRLWAIRAPPSDGGPRRWGLPVSPSVERMPRGLRPGGLSDGRPRPSDAERVSSAPGHVRAPGKGEPSRVLGRLVSIFEK